MLEKDWDAPVDICILESSWQLEPTRISLVLVKVVQKDKDQKGKLETCVFSVVNARALP